ncbi:hypothetical protein [Neobacillus cucumis]|uniref:hypothetical protein n=1 Tax=Neobacillus cucumis TaxID=1740721 RepID=UPI002852FA2F|nr:hypothetical protein [Neobacillus cucumis]MDR4948297.1 hypothetical protein [Neobacillus cucumis]
MKNKRVMLSVFIALLLVLATGIVIWHNQTAFAKSKAKAPSVDAKAIMAHYSPPTSKNKAETTKTTIRRSRLTQMNVLTEAAKVLNVLPINIIDEMKKGKTLVQIAKGKGLTKAQFLQKLSDVDSQIVDKAIKDGSISKEHGNVIKAGQKDRLTKSLTQKAVDVSEHQSMDMGN